MSVIHVRNEKGEFEEIPIIKGEKEIQEKTV